MRNSKLSRLTCVDLFSGCGGFGLGAEMAGYDVIAAVDIEPNLQSSYRLNFPHTETFLADVMQLDKGSWNEMLSNRLGRLDLVIGGPPCQGFSRIGLHKKNDPRNTLIGHYFRHIRLLNPRSFVMENVEGLMDKGNIDYLTEALNELPSYYQIVGPLILNAADLGAATTRKRVVVIGYDVREVDHIDEMTIESLKIQNRVTVQDAISDLPIPVLDTKQKTDFGWAAYPGANARFLSRYAEQSRSFPNCRVGWHEALTNLSHGRISGMLATEHTKPVVKRFGETPPGSVERISRYPRLSWSGQCPTLRAGTGSDKGSFQAMRPIHPDHPRVITVREAARLQGFPDWFVFHPAKWHSFRMIGNSVSPIVSAGLLSLLHEKSALRLAA